MKTSRRKLPNNRVASVNYHNTVSNHGTGSNLDTVTICWVNSPVWSTHTWGSQKLQTESGNTKTKILIVFCRQVYNNRSNSRVSMPTGREDKEGGQGRCWYQWLNTNTPLTDCDKQPTAVLSTRPFCCRRRGTGSRDTLMRSLQRLGQRTPTGAWYLYTGFIINHCILCMCECNNSVCTQSYSQHRK